jgi:hypothetical protein
LKDPKTSVRYLGFRALSGGGRLLDFSFAAPDASLHQVAIEVPFALISGPDHMTVQECSAICYETLKFRLAEGASTFPRSISLTAADILQHRKPGKGPGRR